MAVGAALLLLFVAIINAAPVNAEEMDISKRPVTTQDETDTADTTETDESETTTVTTRNEEKTARLTQARLRVCEKREDKIKNIMARVGDRGTKKLDVIKKIYDRTVAFYNSKYQSEGMILENFDELDGLATAAYETAQAAVTEAIENETFECDSEDPHSSVATFKALVKDRNEALQNYRTAVKNLIVGVKSIHSTTDADASGTDGGEQ